MLGVDAQGCGVVVNRPLEVSLLAVSEAPVVVEIGLVWLQLNGLGEALDGLRVLSFAV